MTIPAQEHYIRLLAGLKGKALSAFACFCAERVMEIYSKYCDPSGLKRILDRAWNCVTGSPLDPDERKELAELALEVTPDTQSQENMDAAHAAACAVIASVDAEDSWKDAAFAATCALEAIHLHLGLPRDQMNYHFPLPAAAHKEIREEHRIHLEAIDRILRIEEASLSKFVFVGLLNDL